MYIHVYVLFGGNAPLIIGRLAPVRLSALCVITDKLPIKCDMKIALQGSHSISHKCYIKLVFCADLPGELHKCKYKLEVEVNRPPLFVFMFFGNCSNSCGPKCVALPILQNDSFYPTIWAHDLKFIEN